MRTFLLLFVALAAEARWLRLTSPHFELYTDDGEARARGLLRRLEQLHGAFHAALGKPVRIVAFGSSIDFKDFRPAGEVAGFFFSGIARDSIFLDFSLGNSQRTVAHEFAHLLNAAEDPFMPLWRNEGLAEFYSTARVTGDSVVVGESIPEHVRILQVSELMSHAELTKVDRTSRHYSEGNRRNIFYAQSWALAHMQFFEQPQADIDRQLHAYVSRAHYATRSIPLSAASAAPIEVTTLDRVDADLLLIDAAITVGKQEWADKHIEQLAAKHPDHPLVRAEAADLLARRGDLAGAKAAYAKAMAASRSGQLRFEYALFLRSTRASDEEVRAALEEAVALEPGFSDARAWLESLQKPQAAKAATRRNEPNSAAPPQIRGTLVQVDCLDQRARLHVVADGRKRLLLVEGAVAGAPVELPCGTLVQGKPVVVQYETNPNSVYGTEGRVVRLALASP